MVAQLRVDEIHVNLLLSDIALLCHLRQCSGEVNDRVATIMLGEKQDGEMLTFILGILARGCSLWGSVGWGVGA